MATALAPPDRSVGSPQISVVITAWDRREFLPQAVDSVLRQSFPAEEREILIIKNFNDPEFDRRFESQGVRLIQDTEKNVGATVARGLSESRGEVVCFLDDDDEFEPGKLARVGALFAADPELVLVRNAYRQIDARSRPLLTWPICDWPATAQPGLTLLRSAADKAGSRVPPMYNLSTMSVRRRPMLRFVVPFRSVPAGSDSLVFLGATATDGTVRVDPEVLNRHRVHASVSMERFDRSGMAPPTGPEYLARAVESLRRQEAIVRGTPAEPWAHWLYLIARFDAYLGRPEFPPPTGQEYLEFVRWAVRERQRFRGPPFVFSVARRAFPKTAFRGWWAYRRRLHQREVLGLDYREVFGRPDEA